MAINRPTSSPTRTRVQVKGTIGKSVQLQQPAADLATLVAQLTPFVQTIIQNAPLPIASSGPTVVYWQNIIGVPPQVVVPPNRVPWDESPEDPYPVPGPQGVRGVAGLSLPPLFADDPEDIAIIPGPQGLQGFNGPVGEPGVPVFMPNDFDLEDVPLPMTPPGGFTGFANPTASLGLTAINGVLRTAMRSDAAPALDVTISPTWTGAAHIHGFQRSGSRWRFR